MNLLFTLIKLHLITPRGIFRLLQSFVSEGLTSMSLLRFASKYYPENTAIVSESERLTYKQFYKKAILLSAILKRNFNIQNSDNVALICRNHTISALLLPSLQRIGANTKALNTDFSVENFQQILSKQKFKLLIYDDEFLSKIPLIVNCKAVTSKYLATFLNDTKVSPAPLPRLKFFKSPNISVVTGGTSGGYKEASRKPSVFQFLPPFFSLLRDIKIQRYQNVLIALPFYHGFGLCTLIISILMGKKISLARYFDAENILQTINNEQIDIFPAVPVMLTRMWDVFLSTTKFHDIKNYLRCIICGGDRLDKKLVNQTSEIFGDILYNLYGTSEAGFFMLATPNDLKINAESTIGKPIFGVKCEIRNPDSNGVGTFWAKSPWAVTSLRNCWQSTGDRVSMNEAGYYFYHGREDRMVVCGGENVYPEDLERALCELNFVTAAKAFPMPDKDFGTVLNVKIELKKGTEISSEEIVNYLKTKITRAAMPHKIEFGNIKSLSTGKTAI
ncbi:MAG: AMP-binding protein [Bacteroidales bacterium]|nr:AMP-binding protein [Bacteroidales bacterium]